MTRIERLAPAWDTAYREFLAAVPEAMIYSSPEFWGFLTAAVGGRPECLLVVRDKQVLGALPYFSASREGCGTVINSLPWYGSHGGCLLRDPQDRECRRLLLEHYAQAVSASEVLAATMVLTPGEMEHLDEYLPVVRPRFQDGRTGQVTELPPTGDGAEERLLSAIQQKTRNLVRKSLKQGFERVVTDEEWAWRFLCETHEENMRAVGGRAKPWAHFQAIRQHIPPGARSLSVALHGGQPAAAVLLLAFNRTVEYLTPVIKVQHRSQQPLSFLIYKGMLDAVERGFRWWNWGGTWASQDSLHHFKAGWGATNRPYAYLINATDEAVAKARSDLESLAQAFAYYYLLPYNAVKP